MIITIDNSVQELSAVEANNDFLSFLDDLCTARKLGDIVIHSSKRTLLTILAREEISRLQKQILKHTNEQVTFKQELFDNINYRMVVFHSDYGFNPLNYQNNFIFIDINNYCKNYSEKGLNPFSPPKLVLEDMNDQNIYMKICEWFTSNNKYLGKHRLSFDILHGGGNRTASICKSLIEKGHNVFCICDSDSKYNGDNVQHETAKKVEEVFTNLGKKDNLYILKCQEVENLIPPSLLAETANQTQQSAINFINHITSLFPEAYMYMDIKNGFTYNSVFKEIPDNYSNYWQPLFLSFTCSSYTGLKLKIESHELPNNSKIICKLSSLIPHAVERLVRSSEIELIEPIRIEWEKIALNLYSWGCASHPIKM
jgi:hypothetical protein